jgi:hypothetical protein
VGTAKTLRARALDITLDEVAVVEKKILIRLFYKTDVLLVFVAASFGMAYCRFVNYV